MFTIAGLGWNAAGDWASTIDKHALEAAHKKLLKQGYVLEKSWCVDDRLYRFQYGPPTGCVMVQYAPADTADHPYLEVAHHVVPPDSPNESYTERLAGSTIYISGDEAHRVRLAATGVARRNLKIRYTPDLPKPVRA